MGGTILYWPLNFRFNHGGLGNKKSDLSNKNDLSYKHDDSSNNHEGLKQHKWRYSGVSWGYNADQCRYTNHCFYKQKHVRSCEDNTRCLYGALLMYLPIRNLAGFTLFGKWGVAFGIYLKWIEMAIWTNHGNLFFQTSFRGSKFQSLNKWWILSDGFHGHFGEFEVAVYLIWALYTVKWPWLLVITLFQWDYTFHFFMGL